MPLVSFKNILQALQTDNIGQIKLGRQTCLNILAVEPDNVLCLQLMGRIECQLGQADSAVNWYAKAQFLLPDSAELQFNYDQALEAQKKFAKVANAIKQQTASLSDQAKAYYCLGNILKKQGNRVSAIGAYNTALAIEANFPAALNNLGVILMDNGMLDEATRFYERALAVKPDHANALNNLGLICRQKSEWTNSIAYYQKALSIKPNFPEVYNNIGTSLQDMGRRAEAIGFYKQALALKKDYADCHNNLAMALLSVGQYDEGWMEYEWRWRSTHFLMSKQKATAPIWRGEAAEGRSILIQAEQGFGDALQFCRYIPWVKARGLHVILEVPAPLLRLMESLSGVEQIIERGDLLPNTDYYCPMMSLPLAFHTRQETIPADIPYLFAQDEQVRNWRSRLPMSKEKRLKVGLVWAGNSHQWAPDLAMTDRRRSISPELFAPLMEIAGIQFYSLQKAGPKAPEQFRLIDLMDECADFADTAALIANLDLIISVDTAVAHLAGALGKTVWLLNRVDTCWRWQMEREDSPWYPMMRIFRQPAPGNWDSVMMRVKEELQHYTLLFKQRI